MRNELSESWKDKYKLLFGDSYVKNKVVVFNWEDFEDWCKSDESALGGDYAIIEIYTSPGKPVLDEDILKMFPYSIIALDFEDMGEDVDFPDSNYHPLNPTINYGQAEQLVRFIEWNTEMGRDFIIHCGAGVSRSQQVAEYIMLTHRTYEYDEEKSTHSHYFFNTIVLSRLLEMKHKLFPDFTNKDGSMVYNNTLDKWVKKDD